MAQVSPQCEICEAEPDTQTLMINWCSACSTFYCETCWDAQPLHKLTNRKSAKHEKTELELANLILSILNPESDEAKQAELHEKNQTSKWFGVMREDGSNRSHFHDFRRFPRLAGGSETDPGDLFPCLISFVGDTGAGKSTMINGLLKVCLPLAYLACFYL